MKRQSILIFIIVLFSTDYTSGAIFLDDGGNHIIDNSTYQNDSVWLDVSIVNNPGTHVDLVDGGWVHSLGAWNNATINMTGGSVELELVAFADSTITMAGGNVGGNLSGSGYSSITMSGGLVQDYVGASGNASVTITSGEIVHSVIASGYSDINIFDASIGANLITRENVTSNMTGGLVGNNLLVWDNSTINVSGGSIAHALQVYDSGIVYLSGTDFEADGTPLEYGDRLSEFGTFHEPSQCFIGNITGTLADGSALDNLFRIYNTGEWAGTADIIVVPEPATLLLLGFGAVVLRKRR